MRYNSCYQYLSIMEIYFIRHGIAAQRGRCTDDEKRPLIDKGIDRTTKVAKRLLEKKVKFDLILTSPLTRTYQTAEILKKIGLSEQIQTFVPLKPKGNIEELLQWLQSPEKEKYSSLALVGHQPDLGNWIEMLIWGTIKNQIIIKKAGVIGISLPAIGTPISRSTLFLLSSPKWII